MKRLRITLTIAFLSALVWLTYVPVFASEGAPAASASDPILPGQFAGWEITGAAKIKTSRDPAAADPVNAALLKEYGFTDFASATYVRNDGRKLVVKAARFSDASGAYGAFTYYKMPPMQAETIGDLAVSLNNRVLFYRGNVLVDAAFEKLTAMSAAELRDLAGSLPVPSGGPSKPPSLPDYLPAQSRIDNSTKYVLGPIGLLKASTPLTVDLVDFGAGAEVVTGMYHTAGGEASLMLISYPTPQIAADHLRRIDAAHQPNPAPAGGPTILDAGPIFSKRTGPILVIAAGPFSQSEAKSLLAAVNYDADVTWNENTYFSKRDNIASLLVNIIILSGIIAAFAIVAGIAFGGIRILVKRFFPGKVFDRPEDMELISLHLSEYEPKTPATR